ncbi:DUF378 domain-containing protein [Noviherbaspirillum aridicola]|nr:DUF378 domain-containing protein [Noviherbaspirillum aridicola]
MATVEGLSHDRRHIPDRRSSSRGHASSSKRMGAMDWIAMVLLIVGGINWGLVGLFDVDLVAMLFGEGSALGRVVYVLVGLSALYSIYTSSKMSRAR